jgi:arylsulfatase A-like enzyme
MMLKRYWTFAAVLILAAGFFLFLNTGGCSRSEKPGPILLNQVLFFNDCYRQYDSFSHVNLPDKLVENEPHLDYFKYGGADRKKMKAVFIPVGSTLTYQIQTTPYLYKKVTIDGYLGSVGEKPITFKITANGKPIVEKKISVGPPYFKVRVDPEEDRLTLAISVEGENGTVGAVGVLGNMCLYRRIDKRRNIVFYLVDALRADMAGVDKKLFESYFEDGAIFTSAYANATLTSLAAIFSGKYKFTLVEKDEDFPRIDENEHLLAEYLKARGYTTAAFINNPWLDHTNASQGFDFVNHCWGYVAGEKASAFPSKELYVASKYGEMEDYIHRFVRENKEKQVFIYIHTMEPHVPYEPPLEMRNYSANADRTILNTLFEKVTQSPSYPVLIDPTNEQLNVLKALYKDQILIAYDFFMKTNNYLESELIINPQSLYIFSADHGERFYKHRSWIHGPPDVYNGVLRIPLMIKGPGIKAGVYNQNVQSMDIYPTVVDWWGDKPLENLPGKSLLDREPVERIIYSDGIGNSHYAFISGKMKVIIKGNTAEVYDLEKDPDEKTNLRSRLEFKNLIDRAKGFREKFARTGKGKENRLSEQEQQRLKTLGYVN